MQACLKVTSQFRAHVRGAIVVHLMKIIMDSSVSKGEGRISSWESAFLRLEALKFGWGFEQQGDMSFIICFWFYFVEPSP